MSVLHPGSVHYYDLGLDFLRKWEIFEDGDVAVILRVTTIVRWYHLQQHSIFAIQV